MSDEWRGAFERSSEGWKADVVKLAEAEAEIATLRQQLAEAREALARQQEPEGQRQERVAEWLRSKGYSVALKEQTP